jgi:hypothetical protein
MLSVSEAAVKALESAQAAVAKAEAYLDDRRGDVINAQGHLYYCKQHTEECETRLQLVREHAKECTNLITKIAGPCPPVDNAPDHAYITRIDLGGGRNPQNCGRHYLVVSSSQYTWNDN